MTPNDRTEPGVCTRCGDTRVIPIGDGYSVNPCPNCTMFHQQQPAQPLYDSLGRCINFRDVHPAQPDSGEVSRLAFAAGVTLGELHGNESAELQCILRKLIAAQQRIAELESELENERARGIHTCHDQCERPLCVAQRRIAALEAWQQRAIATILELATNATKEPS